MAVAVVVAVAVAAADAAADPGADADAGAGAVAVAVTTAASNPKIAGSSPAGGAWRQQALPVHIRCASSICLRSSRQQDLARAA